MSWTRRRSPFVRNFLENFLSPSKDDLQKDVFAGVFCVVFNASGCFFWAIKINIATIFQNFHHKGGPLWFWECVVLKTRTRLNRWLFQQLNPKVYNQTFIKSWLETDSFLKTADFRRWLKPNPKECVVLKTRTRLNRWLFQQLNPKLYNQTFIKSWLETDSFLLRLQMAASKTSPRLSRCF